ncbi:hypothetical protein QBC47DRAFT_388177 [Echria macrotheca]|uniref:Uncharacterized protein n=1 Tax=Echria macrotheca TaxID=438768 RepID=A0AAJ0BAT4_9PEZI|nr:hypothetical protein QBC47DRAFT_388177 [Echria macrotheca]
MSRPIPRRGKHRKHPSGNGSRRVAASDHESDAANYMETHPQAPEAAESQTRSNTELNLSVLRRYLPRIESIRSIAANAVVYTLSDATTGWERRDTEGTMFVCQQEALVTDMGLVVPNVCVFVLNRRGLENLAVDLVRVSDCEIVDGLISLRLEQDGGLGSGGEGTGEVIGLWVHADEEDTRDTNWAIIKEAWEEARLALQGIAAAVAEADQAAEQTDVDDGGALADSQPDIPGRNGAAVGRQISVAELFGQGTTAG